MEHNHLGALLDVPVIVVDGGDANSATNTTAESPAAGNNGANGDHLVDAEDFKNMKLAIGTVDRTILEISLGDNLTGGTRNIDIRLRQNNRRQADSEISGTEQEQQQQQHKFPPPPGDGSSRLKITVAAGDEQPDPESDSDAKYLDKMRGWLMTVATLFVGITFTAAIQPPDWIKRWPDGSDSDKNTNEVAFKPAEYAGAGLYLFSNSAVFGSALYVVLFLVFAPRTTSSAKQTMDSVRRVMTIYSICLAVTFAMATPATSWASLGFALLVGSAGPGRGQAGRPPRASDLEGPHPSTQNISGVIGWVGGSSLHRTSVPGSPCPGPV